MYIAGAGTAKEEHLQRYSHSRDLKLRNELVTQHERLVYYVAGRFSSSSAVEREDLIQVGFIGLIEAIERYDPTVGTAFSTFAIVSISGVIKRYLRDHTWLISTPRVLSELALRARRLRPSLEASLGRPATVTEIARALEVSEERLLHALEAAEAYTPASLDRILTASGREAAAAPLSEPGDEDPEIARAEARVICDAALGRLDTRSRAILRRRFLLEQTQVEVANALGISQMHVSRLERRALEALRTWGNSRLQAAVSTPL